LFEKPIVNGENIIPHDDIEAFQVFCVGESGSSAALWSMSQPPFVSILWRLLMLVYIAAALAVKQRVSGGRGGGR
jgi:hypothetical protein